MGDLREFLADAIVGVQDGRVDPLQADRISKLAGQITSSLMAETQIALVNVKAGGKAFELGATPIGGRGEIVEHAPVAIKPPEPRLPPVKPAVVAPAQRSTERVFCEQCDRNVTVSEAVACKSAFCKAKAAA